MKLGIDIQHRLNIVIPGRDVAQTVSGGSKRAGIDHGRLVRLQLVDVDAEDGGA
jgi:hypothetical protein